MTAVVCIRKGELSTWTVCKCEDCSLRSQRLHKLARNGRFERIPSEQGVTIIRQMMAAKMTCTSIATAVGVSPGTASGWIAKLRAGRPLRLGAVACSRLVNAQQPTDGLVGTLIPMRMLRALGRIGWSAEELTRRARQRGLTIGMNTLWTIRKGRTDRVHATVANVVADLYRELHMTPGKADQTIRIATAEDWAAPLAWDDITDPDEQPSGVLSTAWERAGYDESRVQRRIDGDRTVRLHRGETVEVVRRLLAEGQTQAAIRRLTGLKPERYMAEIRATQELEEVA